MKTAVYQGFADVRVLSTRDIPELSGEHRFPKGVGVEVNEKVAKTLSENADLYGDFLITDDSPEDVELDGLTDDASVAEEEVVAPPTPKVEKPAARKG